MELLRGDFYDRSGNEVIGWKFRVNQNGLLSTVNQNSIKNRGSHDGRPSWGLLKGEPDIGDNDYFDHF